MISPNRIRFGGIFSNELNMPDLIMDCAFESDNSEVSTFLTREAVASETYDGRNRRISSFKYTENFSPKFTFLKNGFGDFTQDEIRALLKYLTSKDTTGLLEAYDDDSNVISWASIGNFSEIQLYKIANKRVVGVTAVWDSISPFALSERYTVTKTISSPTDNKIIINIDTDDNKPVYPHITIQQTDLVVRIPDGTVYTATTDMVPNTVYYNGSTYYWKTAGRTSATTPPSYEWDTVEVDHALTSTDTLEENKIYYYMNTMVTPNTIIYYWIDPYYFHKQDGGTAPTLATTSVRLTNTHTDFFNKSKPLQSVIVKNNNSTEKIELDGANKIVSSSSVRRIFGDDFNWNWLELRDGKNEITIEGNCEVTLSWREARKVGEY